LHVQIRSIRPDGLRCIETALEKLPEEVKDVHPNAQAMVEFYPIPGAVTDDPALRLTALRRCRNRHQRAIAGFDDTPLA
jgi:hypothetical protein